MECAKIRENLSLYIDGQLSPEEESLVQEHLRTCSSCRQYYEELKAMKEALRSLPVMDPPKEMHAKIMNAVSNASSSEKVGNERDETSREKRSLGGWRRFFVKMSPFVRRWAPAAVAACLLVAFSSFGTFLVLQRWPGLLAQPEMGIERSPVTGAPKSEPDQNTQKKSSSGATGRSADAQTPPGVGGGLPESTYGVSPSAVPDSGQKGFLRAGGAAADSLLSSIEKKMVRTARITIEVSRGGVDRVSRAVLQTVEKLQGYVENSQSSSSEKEKGKVSSFYVTARVPAEKLDEAVSEISGFGKLISQGYTAQDVTGQYIDLEARLRSKTIQEQRLLTILGQAKSTGELLQVEGELARVRSDIESMERQKQYYDKVTTMSALSVSVIEEGSIAPGPPSPTAQAWSAFVNAWSNVLIYAAKKSPYIMVGLGVVFAGYSYLRQKTKR